MDERTTPLAYFLTFVSYGTWLHGDKRGSIDSGHNEYGAPRRPADEALMAHRREQLAHDPMRLTPQMRRAVDSAIVEMCEHRGWTLRAANVRTNHVHVVVTADKPSDHVLRDFKACATRRLRSDGLVGKQSRVWASGGSQRKLWKRWGVDNAVNYTLHEQ